tara:strand:+ start:39 stop:473 length:435 start_codon:yes stop_codon:yes gene_type:complete
VEGAAVGTIGQVDAALADSFSLTRDTYIFELACDPLFGAWAARGTAYQPLPKFPPIERDLAIVLGDQVPSGRVADEIRSVAPDLVDDVRLFDVYSGDQVEAGKRSLAFSLCLRSPDRTLEDRDADGVVERVLQRLEKSFEARLR